MNALMTWAHRAIDLVYPRNCQFCATPLAEADSGVICRSCLGTVRWIEEPFCQQCASPFAGEVREAFVCGYCQDLRFYFERTVCACRAEGIVRDCLVQFKYNRAAYFGPHLVEWLNRAASQWIDWQQVDCIVPVPLHPRKRRHREFNQAEYLATGLARSVGAPVVATAVRRVKDTSTQTRLDAETRRRNLRDAFAIQRPAAVAEKRVVLLDDVFTTGATLDSCAKVLRKAGATQVIALALARGI